MPTLQVVEAVFSAGATFEPSAEQNGIAEPSTQAAFVLRSSVFFSCFQAYILGCRVYTVWCRASTCSTRTTLAYPIFVVAKVCISARARFRSNRALQKDICD